MEMGLDLESAKIQPNAWLTTFVNQQELDKLRSKGIKCELVIEDVQSFYRTRPRKFFQELR